MEGGIRKRGEKQTKRARRGGEEEREWERREREPWSNEGRRRSDGGKEWGREGDGKGGYEEVMKERDEGKLKEKDES